MAMNVRYGAFTNETSDDFLVPINFPTLMQMDEWTPDGRRFQSAGGGVRPLPFSIKAQFETYPGHATATVVGVLQEVEFHEDGHVSGKGWLVNTPEGHKAALLARTGALRRNSVDLADVIATIDWKSDDPDDPGYWELVMDASEWNIGTTTLVDIPAFPTATAGDAEVTASFVPAEGEVLTVEFETSTVVIPEQKPEIVADGAIIQPFADFHLPEPLELTPITVTPDGCVFFHLAEWGKPHRGMQGYQMAPRPASYASFNCSQVLTDRGMVNTGPVFLYGGHPDKPIGSVANASAAYGGTENAWCDVRVTNGRLGPWACGRVRPGTSEESIYVARASRLSGHWVGEDLAAIVSVNVPAYDVARQPELVAALRFPDSKLSVLEDGVSIGENGEVLELVASLRTDTPEARRESLKRYMTSKMMNPDGTVTLTSTSTANAVVLSFDDAMVAEAMQRINDGEPTPSDATAADAQADLELEAEALQLQVEIDLALSGNLPFEG